MKLDRWGKIVLVAILVSVVHTYNLTNETYLLAFAECINVTDGENFLMVCAPGFPKFNQTINLSYDESAFFPNINLTVQAPPYPKVNVNRTLTYNEIFNHTLLNITLRAPIFPTINQNIMLQYDENYQSPQLNFSVKCPPFPIINATLLEGSAYTNSSIRVLCVSKLKNERIVLNYDQTYIDSDHNITYVAPPFPSANRRIYLRSGENTESYNLDSRYNLSVSCEHINLTPLLECQSKKSDLEIQSQTLKNNLSLTQELYSKCVDALYAINKSAVPCNTTVLSFCADNAVLLCTAEEKLKGDQGIRECMERITSEANKTKSEFLAETTRLNTELAQCRSGEAVQKELQENLMIIIAGIAGIFAAGILMVMYLKRKQAQNE